MVGTHPNRLVAALGDQLSRLTADGADSNATFDRTVQELATGTSRRTLLRGLAAGLFAAGGGGLATNALARKKGKGKAKGKKKSKKQPVQSPPQNPPQRPPQSPPAPTRCTPGTSLGFLAIPANGTSVFTPDLEQGQNYILRATGFWSTNGNFFNDAFAAFDATNPVLHHTFDNGIRVGLAVNGDSPDLWGHYNLDHVYNVVLIGKGEPVALRMIDAVYTDNARLLNVEVLCAR